MLHKATILIALLGPGCLTGGGPRPDESGDGGVDVAAPPCDFDLSSYLDEVGVPGLSAGIVKDGRLACTAVAGHADIEADRPVTPDTVFHWASVSKAVTAVTAMSMFDDGLLDLDASVEDALPFAVRNPGCPDAPITFRQLFTHTSSIIDSNAYSDTYVVGDSPIGLGEYVRGYVTPGGAYYDAADNFEPACPGEVNEYSNISVALLGHALEEISGVPFDDLSRARVFDPLDMRDTSYRIASIDPARLATPYRGSSPATFQAHGQVGYPTLPDGMLRSSVPQLAKVLAMMAEGGVYQGQRILAETTVAEMRRSQIPELDSTQGLLWFYDGAVFGHDGSDPGTSSFMYFDPESGDGVLLVANADWYALDDDARAAYQLLGDLFDEAASL